MGAEYLNQGGACPKGSANELCCCACNPAAQLACFRTVVAACPGASNQSNGSTGSIGEEATVSLRKPGSSGPKEAGSAGSDKSTGGPGQAEQAVEDQFAEIFESPMRYMADTKLHSTCCPEALFYVEGMPVQALPVGEVMTPSL